MDSFHIKILKELVQFKTITPNGEDAIDFCFDFLQKLGFKCQKFHFGDVTNLYAKLGDFEKNLCFAGHIDVVPPSGGWSSDPFVLTEKNGKFFGRGTNDMKGPLSACFAAINDFLKEGVPEFSLSIMLTSDEEIMGGNGTKHITEVLKSKNEKITGCVLCESCSPVETGEYIKIGCRGSLNINLRSIGEQCHVANGKFFGNHLHSFIEFLNNFVNIELDKGNENFSPSEIEITSIDVGNNVRNIIPRIAEAKINIRFNDNWTFNDLESFIQNKKPSHIEVSFERFGYPFVGTSANFIEFLSKSIEKSIGKPPKIGTSGGNSDALFIREITDVVEIGAPILGAHIVNEFITSEDLIKLRKIYFNILKMFHVEHVKKVLT